MTTLSIIIPAYNVADYIGDLLVSLTRNSRDDYEFIFVDDGSDDLTAEVLEGYRNRLPGFTVVRHHQPKGLSGARNAGLRAASGRLVTYMDGDDWLAPGYLPRAVEAIDALGCDFIKTDHVRVYGRRREVHRAPQGVRGVPLNPRDAIAPMHDMTMVDYPNAWSGIYRRELAEDGLLDFDEELHTCEDRPWTWRLFRHAASYGVVSLFGVHYRREVSGSLTQLGDERQLHYIDAFDKVLAQLDGDAERDRFYPKAVHNYCELITWHVRHEERLPPPLRQRQRTRVRRVLRELDPGTLFSVQVALGRERARMLSELSGDGVVW